MKRSLIAICSCVSCTTVPFKDPSNFHLVEPGLYRSGRPEIGVIKYLHDTYNIKTIISLETYAAGEDYKAKEVQAALANGIAFINLSMNSSGDLDKEKVLLGVRTIQSVARPILVHCYRGAERTGVVIGAYRIMINKWTYASAVTEMDSFGFSPLYKSWKKTLKEIEAGQ